MENQQDKKIPMPIIMSSDMARKQYEKNLLKLQGYEIQFHNANQPVEKPKPTQTQNA